MEIITIKTHYKFSCIYQIRNLINEKIYVGSAFNFHKRIQAHEHRLRFNKHVNKHIQAAYNKYGKDNFVFEILEECEKEKIIEREQFWIDKLKPQYNLNLFAANSSGRKLSLESIEKMRKSLTGKKHTEESKRKMSESRKGKPHKKGYKFSKETRDKMSASKIGSVVSEETKLKISKAHKGKVMSLEARQKMSQAAYKRYSNG